MKRKKILAGLLAVAMVFASVPFTMGSAAADTAEDPNELVVIDDEEDSSASLTSGAAELSLDEEEAETESSATKTAKATDEGTGETEISSVTINVTEPSEDAFMVSAEAYNDDADNKTFEDSANHTFKLVDDTDASISNIVMARVTDGNGVTKTALNTSYNDESDNGGSALYVYNSASGFMGCTEPIVMKFSMYENSTSSSDQRTVIGKLWQFVFQENSTSSTSGNYLKFNTVSAWNTVNSSASTWATAGALAKTEAGSFVKEWHEVVAIYTGQEGSNSLVFYVDGEKYSSTTVSDAGLSVGTESNKRFTLGYNPNNTASAAYFDGYLSDVEVYQGGNSITLPSDSGGTDEADLTAIDAFIDSVQETGTLLDITMEMEDHFTTTTSWTTVDSTGVATALDSSATYSAGTTYQATVTLTPKEGYAFSEEFADSNLTFYLTDSTTGTGTTATADNVTVDDEGHLVVTYTFAEEAYEALNTEAEKIDSALYTKASYEALTTAMNQSTASATKTAIIGYTDDLESALYGLQVAVSSVTIDDAATGMSEGATITLEPGEALRLTGTATPAIEGEVCDATLTWTSDDNEYVTVTNGYVTVSEEYASTESTTVTITATSANGNSDAGGGTGKVDATYTLNIQATEYEVKVTDGKIAEDESFTATDATSKKYTTRQRAYVTADEPSDGQKFLYWATTDDVIKCYSENYTFPVVANTDLKAVFGSSEDEVEEKATISCSVNADNLSKTGRISFTANRVVPSSLVYGGGSTVEAHGIYLWVDIEPTKDSDGNVTNISDSVYWTSATTNALLGAYTVNVSYEESHTIYAVAYVTYKNTTGESVTIYSNIERYPSISE